MTLAGVVLVAAQLAGANAVSVSDDARTVPHRVAALDAIIAALPSPGVEAAAGAALEALERLDPESALSRARTIMDLPVSERLSLVALRVAARAGDETAVRTALDRYFLAPDGWRRVLGDAAAANDDVRLRDFLGFARLPDPPSVDVFETTLLLYLGERRAYEMRLPADDDDVEAGDSARFEAADAFATMYRFRDLDPRALLDMLEGDDAATRRRAQRVMALAGETKRLPLLVELAVAGRGWERDAAFRGLAAMELGEFDKRLHRLAGDADRNVRFQTALAVVPAGEDWAIRLLVANVDAADPIERRRARRALERLPDADAMALLEPLLSDGTATPFAIEVYLDVTEEHERNVSDARLWAMLSPHVGAEDRSALRAAARLDDPEARAAVVRYLDRR